jgi:DNA-binding LacI/PurR family transcriptional regulator
MFCGVMRGVLVTATLRDVAARAGVSVRTVSNVVNTPDVVAATTRETVRLAIEELGYRPNAAARQLRRGHTDVISLVVPEIDSPYFAELAALVVRGAEARGWTVRVEQTDGDPQREQEMLDGARGDGVDGVVFSPWSLTADDVARRVAAPPVVMLGEQPGTHGVDHVAVDSVAAAREAVEHLLATGRRRIAAVGLQPQLRNQTARQRLTGYRTALEAAGIAADPRLEVVVDRLHRADGAAAAEHLLDSGAGPDALFCFSDQLALGALHALAGRGVTVPDDVALVGFDDIEDGRYAVPALTTVAPDKLRLVEAALDCLAERRVGPGLPGRDVVVPYRLVVRASS